MARRVISKRLRKNRRKSRRSQRGGQVTQLRVTTLAGSGKASFADGKGAAASFSSPNCVAVDSMGNVYVSDTNNHRIRIIKPDGQVSTFAGSGQKGRTNGKALEASFDYPWGVVVDSVNNVYIADVGNCMIRKISPMGEVSTFAGSGNASFADGNGTGASFKWPLGIAIDSENTIYVADTYNQRIRKITTKGDVTTLAGDGNYDFANGPGKSAKFQNPYGVAVDSEKNVYVSDTFNQLIRIVRPDGNTSTLAGAREYSFANGIKDKARFRAPSGIAIDRDGNVYVGDQGNNQIRKIDKNGLVSTFAGAGVAAFADGSATEAKFNNPQGVAVDRFGNVYVADVYNNRIRIIATAGNGTPPTLTAMGSISAVPTLTARGSVSAVPTLTAMGSISAVPTLTARGSVSAVPTLTARNSVSVAPTLTARNSVSVAPTLTARNSVSVAPTPTMTTRSAGFTGLTGPVGPIMTTGSAGLTGLIGPTTPIPSDKIV